MLCLRNVCALSADRTYVRKCSAECVCVLCSLPTKRFVDLAKRTQGRIPNDCQDANRSRSNSSRLKVPQKEEL